MRLKNSLKLGALIGLGLTVGHQSAFAAIHLNPFHHKHKPAPETEAAPAIDGMPLAQPEQMIPAAQSSAPDALTLYDDVGYASQGISGGVSLAHPALPQPSYVEITNLNSGKTILAVVSGSMARARDAALLSPQAMAMLGGTNGQRIPVRMRRVNPPEQEQAALLAGRPASDRLDTPSVLLTALKRKLAGTQGKYAGGAGADEPMQAASTPRVVSVKAPARASVAARDKPAVYRPTTSVPEASDDNSRFIVENAGAPSSRFAASKARIATPPPPPRPAQNQTPAAAPLATSGAFYIQVAALSSESGARAMAARLGKGATVVVAGQYWRVRTGPYASEEKARAALGPLAAKGYRDVRLTH